MRENPRMMLAKALEYHAYLAGVGQAILIAIQAIVQLRQICALLFFELDALLAFLQQYHLDGAFQFAMIDLAIAVEIDGALHAFHGRGIKRHSKYEHCHEYSCSLAVHVGILHKPFAETDSMHTTGRWRHGNSVKENEVYDGVSEP